MENPDLAKNLWDLSNVIVGFSMAQTLAFIYKMADPSFADPVDNKVTKIVLATATVASFAVYILGFFWITRHLVELSPVHARLYEEACRWRLAIVLLLMPANLAALFGRQILLRRWLFGYPRPIAISLARAGWVTVIGKIAIARDHALTLTDPTGDLTVNVDGVTAEELARSGSLDRVIVVGRLHEQGHLDATRIFTKTGRVYSARKVGMPQN